MEIIDSITIENLKNIKTTLIYDEEMQTYVLCGDSFKIMTYSNPVSEMKTRVRNTPQIEDMRTTECVRLMVFKDFTKIYSGNKYKKYNTFNIVLYVPTRLHDNDFRIYRLEKRIEDLLNKIELKGVSKLEYVDGRFVECSVENYSAFKMTFIIQEGTLNGR